MKRNLLAAPPDIYLAHNKSQQISVELNFTLPEASPVDREVFANQETEYHQVNQ